MNSTVEAIVLSRIPYSEHSYIINLYTKEEGRTVAFLRGNSRKKAAQTLMVHPLALMSFTLEGKGQMPYVKHYESVMPMQTLPFDPIKSCVALFLAEMLSLTLKERCADQRLFDFIKTHIAMLDTLTEGIANFHIYFLLHLSRWLGFAPNLDQHGDYIDLREGIMTPTPPLHPDYTSPEITKCWHYFLNTDYAEAGKMPLSRASRKQCLEQVVKFYQIQMPEIKEIKSLNVIQQVFD
ncbi:MAG: DNA repair protein RecO [Bacteroidales bacterium]|nr:DNA repair protein RecO [Bacteroidales bacterium]